MKKFMLCGVSCMALFAANNALAADGYVCEESVMHYTSCKKGYYLTTSESGLNVCNACPSLETLLGDRFDELEDAISYSWSFDEYGQSDGMQYLLEYYNFSDSCRMEFNLSFDIPGGHYQEDMSSIKCAVVTTDVQVEEFDAVKGEYVCFLATYFEEFSCNAGYVLSDFSSSRYDANTNVTSGLQDGEVLLIRNIGALACEKVAEGYYASDDFFPQYAKECSDTEITADKIKVGQYCPGGTSEPLQCPQATNALNGAVVYGVTGISGATSIAQCKLPAGDVEYENDVGTYQLVDTCGYISGASDEGMRAACLKYKEETENEYIDCDSEDLYCDMLGNEHLIYDPDGGGIACYENMDCQNDTLITLKGNCETSGGTWDSSTALCTCETGKSFTCNTASGIQDYEGNPTFMHWCAE